MKHPFLWIFLVLTCDAFSQTIPTPGPHALQRREIVYSDEYLRVVAKMDESLKAHPEEYLEWMEGGNPGTPLGYNPILGITQEEFDIYLLHAERYVCLECKERKMLLVERAQGGMRLLFSRLYELPDVFIKNDLSYAVIEGKKLQKDTDGYGRIIFWEAAQEPKRDPPREPIAQSVPAAHYRLTIRQERKSAWSIDYSYTSYGQGKQRVNQYMFLLE